MHGYGIPESPELIELFCFDGADTSSLHDRARGLLCDVASRARAKKLTDGGVYDVILEGACVRELLGYTLWRAGSENIYSGYSSAYRSEPQEGNIPDITLCPTEDFSDEGVRMRELELVRDGELKNIVGGARHCHYLGTPVTGVYKKLRAECTGTPLSSLLSGKVLYVRSFSDFQFDPLDGYFGGEVRLGYLYDNGKRTPVTGFCISGNYKDRAEHFEFSSEGCSDYTYEGPLAVRIKDVDVT